MIERFSVKIPKSGDLLAGVYIDFKLKDLLRTGADYVTSNQTPDTSKKARFTSYVNGMSYNIISSIKL